MTAPHVAGVLASLFGPFLVVFGIAGLVGGLLVAPYRNTVVGSTGFFILSGCALAWFGRLELAGAKLERGSI